jgi:Cdc6-like AAA superfamily ATPase
MIYGATGSGKTVTMIHVLSTFEKVAEKALRIDRVDQAAASRETGDARKAVELLAKAVRVAEETSGHLGEKEVDIAESRLEVDKTIEFINARIVSLGRYGKTREIMSSLPDRVVKRLI